MFEVLSIAQELGIDELRISCEDHITNTLSIHNACTFLAAAIDSQERTSGKSTTKSILENVFKIQWVHAGQSFIP